MRSSWKALAACAAGLIVAPGLAAADDVQAQLKVMQERMSQLEDRLQATTDQLEVTEQRAAEQQKMLTEAGVAEASGSKSGLDSFVESIELGGYVDATYNYNINHINGGPTAALGAPLLSGTVGGNGLYSFMGDASGFNLNALKFEIERPISIENRGGFRADIFFGQTARALNNAGSIGGFGRVLGVGAALGAAGVAVPGGLGGLPIGAAVADTRDDSQVHVSQAYAQYLVPWGDITLKAGKFFTLIGAEVVESPYNYNITRSILFFNVPFEHVGVLAEKQHDNGITWALGVVNGWDRDAGADFNKSKSLLGRFGWVGENYGVLGNLIYGAEQPNNERNKRGLFDLVINANPIEELSMYLNFDFGWEEFAGSMPNQKTTFWWGVAGAGRYAITDRLGIALRAEWFQDDRSGFFCTQAQVGCSQINNAGMVIGPVNAASSAYEVTATVDYALTSQLTARAEFRADWVSNQYNSDQFFQSASYRPLQSNQQTLIAQLYYTF